MIALSGIMDRTLREQPGRGTCEGLVALAVILAALFYYVPVRHTDQYLERHRGRFVAGVALGVAWFLYVHPEVWLMFDGGFRVWAWLGYAVPPFIDAAGPWDLAETSTWLRDGDVVVATGTKSGTTWMLYTSHLIRTRADATQFPFLDPMYNTPWMELQQRPGQTWAERKAAWNTTRVPVHWNAPQGSDYAGEKDGDYAGEQDGMKCRDDDSGQTVRLQCLWDHAAYPFRIFKSHLTPRVSSGLPSGLPSGLLSDVFQAMQTGSGFLPVRERPAVKFVAMVRNGLDVVASRIPFHEAHSAQFRSMWGGFPPRAGTEATVCLSFLFAGPCLSRRLHVRVILLRVLTLWGACRWRKRPRHGWQICCRAGSWQARTLNTSSSGGRSASTRTCCCSTTRTPWRTPRPTSGGWPRFSASTARPRKWTASPT
jgi:hypothetical protein